MGDEKQQADEYVQVEIEVPAEPGATPKAREAAAAEERNATSHIVSPAAAHQRVHAACPTQVTSVRTGRSLDEPLVA